VPTTHDKFENADGKYRFTSKAGSLEVQMSGAIFSPSVSVVAAGNSPIGRGVHGAIPLHLVFEAQDVIVSPQKPLKYRLTLIPK